MNIKVVKMILKKLPQFIFVSIFCTVSLSGFAQGQIFGEFSIQFSQSWIYDGAKSTTDYFVFINGEAGLELVLKKNSVPCANPQEFNKQILPVIQDFQKAQWIIEQRKPSAPYSFAGQAGIHVMKLKSRASGQQKFILNPVVKGKMYQLEISSATTSIEMPAAAIDFVSRISTSDSQATAVKQEDLQGTQGKANDVFISVAENKPNPGSAVNNDVSGISKVNLIPKIFLPEPRRKVCRVILIRSCQTKLLPCLMGMSFLLTSGKPEHQLKLVRMLVGLPDWPGIQKPSLMRWKEGGLEGMLAR
jgi:hypothetical protein